MKSSLIFYLVFFYCVSATLQHNAVNHHQISIVLDTHTTHFLMSHCQTMGKQNAKEIKVIEGVYHIAIIIIIISKHKQARTKQTFGTVISFIMYIQTKASNARKDSKLFNSTIVLLFLFRSLDRFVLRPNSCVR
jgi:hypothetical protein